MNIKAVTSVAKMNNNKQLNYEIETEEDYREALNRFLEICKDPKDAGEVKEMYLLMSLMERYELDNCSFS